MYIRCEGGDGLKIRLAVDSARGLLGGLYANKRSVNTAARAVYDCLDRLSAWADASGEERDRRFLEPLRRQGFRLHCASLFDLQPEHACAPPPQWPIWNDWVELKLLERRRFLDDLKVAGERLYDAVFRNPAAQVPPDRLEAAMQKAYQNPPYDHRIVVQPHAQLSIPWGFLIDPNYVAPTTDDIARYGGFWAMRYDISVTSQPVELWRSDDEAVDLGVLSLIEQTMEDRVRNDLGEEGHAELFNRPPIGTAHSYQECTRYLKSKENHRIDVLLHYLGHHDGGQLLMGDDQIDYDRFRGLLGNMAVHRELRRDGSYGLMLINGCGSARPREDATLLSAFDEFPELCGAIATEANVRRPFAAEFARRFIRLLRQGETISAAMFELHHAPDLWPESLLYSCYASPDYRVERLAPGAQLALTIGQAA